MNSRGFFVVALVLQFFFVVVFLVFEFEVGQMASGSVAAGQPPMDLAPTKADIELKARHREWELMSMIRLSQPQTAQFLVDPFVGFGSSEPAPCRWLAAHGGPGESRALPTQPPLVQALQDQCHFSLSLRAVVLPTLFRLAYTGQGQSSFHVLDVSFGSQHLWRTFGLFPDEGSCIAIRNEALRHGYGVRACRPWHPEA